MNCKLSHYASPGTPVEVRNRQMAALYLHAARSAGDAIEQEDLRRRAARLISRHPVDRTRRLACLHHAAPACTATGAQSLRPPQFTTSNVPLS